MEYEVGGGGGGRDSRLELFLLAEFPFRLLSPLEDNNGSSAVSSRDPFPLLLLLFLLLHVYV